MVTEAFGCAPREGALTSYKLIDCKLEVISGSVGSHQNASCWVEISEDDAYAYTANTPDRTIRSNRVRSDGTLEFLESIDGETEPGSFVLDAEIAGNYLF